MRKLMLCISGFMLLVIHVNAQTVIGGGVVKTPQPPTPPKIEVVGVTVAPSASYSASGTITVSPRVNAIKPKVYSYSVSGNVVSTVSGVGTVAPVGVNGNANVVTAKEDSVYVYNDRQEQSDDPMKSKTFSKSFALDRNDKILLDNIYGSMVIKTWSKNEIKVDVDIKAYAKTEEEAQKLLDNVSIVATKSGDLVSYKTAMEDRSGSWGSSIRNGKTIWRREAKVYYTVYMPANNDLKASQQYGNLQLDDFSGPTSLKVAYGNLTAGNLSNAVNNINVQYGKSAIESVNEAKVRHQYGGGVNIGSANELEMDVQYASVTLGAIKNNLNIKVQYGPGVSVVSAGSLSLTAQYTKVKVDRLSGNFTGKLQYGGGLSISAVEPGCKVFNCDAEYAGVTLGFTPGYNGTAHVYTQYGSFRYPSDVTVKKTGDNEDKSWSTDKNYTAQIGRGGTNNIQIHTRYQGVTFK